jgi:hypothetical protein
MVVVVPQQLHTGGTPPHLVCWAERRVPHALHNLLPAACCLAQSQRTTHDLLAHMVPRTAPPHPPHTRRPHRPPPPHTLHKYLLACLLAHFLACVGSRHNKQHGCSSDRALLELSAPYKGGRPPAGAQGGATPTLPSTSRPAAAAAHIAGSCGGCCKAPIRPGFQGYRSRGKGRQSRPAHSAPTI